MCANWKLGIQQSAADMHPSCHTCGIQAFIFYTSVQDLSAGSLDLFDMWACWVWQRHSQACRRSLERDWALLLSGIGVSAGKSKVLGPLSLCTHLSNVDYVL